jgi:hypothetical protein
VPADIVHEDNSALARVARKTTPGAALAALGIVYGTGIKIGGRGLPGPKTDYQRLRILPLRPRCDGGTVLHRHQFLHSRPNKLAAV